MRKKNLCFALVLWSIFPIFANNLFAAPTNPPVLSVQAQRDGVSVIVSGSVEDEKTDSVTIVIHAGGPASSITVPVVNGRFSKEVVVPIFEETITVKARDEDGLTDTEIVDVAFEPSSRASK